MKQADVLAGIAMGMLLVSIVMAGASWVSKGLFGPDLAMWWVAISINAHAIIHLTRD